MVPVFQNYGKFWKIILLPEERIKILRQAMPSLCLQQSTAPFAEYIYGGFQGALEKRLLTLRVAESSYLCKDFSDYPSSYQDKDVHVLP